MDLSKLDPKTPVLVGIGTVQQKDSDPSVTVEAWQLMLQAIQHAERDAGVEDLASHADSIQVPKGTWNYSNPAALLKEAVGASSARTVLGNIGVLQQTLITRACTAIQEGKEQLSIVVGGEAKYRNIQISKSGLDLPDAEETSEPDEFLTITEEIIPETEIYRGMAMPVSPYAIMESAMRYEAGLDIEEHRQSLGELYARFSAIAADNPDAWFREPFNADEIAQSSPANKMLAFPYTKRMNTQWNVDQAAALIITSVENAQKLGIDQSKWVFPLAATESDHMTPVSSRTELHRCHGAKIAGERVLELLGIGIDDIDMLEFYSCFPSAVKAYAKEMGVSAERDLTVCGSMAFAGGPLNSFVLQSSATLLRALRDKPGTKGLVTAVSGMLTKQAFAVWSTTPNTGGFVCDDVSEQTAAAADIKTLQPDYQGPARVVGYTVNQIPGFPEAIVAVCDTPDGGRAIANSEDAELIRKVCAQEFCGHSVEINADSQITSTSL